MKKIILHIGRHKTGTSSIQKFNYLNVDFLKENGYFYPKKSVKRGFAHHTLAESLQRKNFRKTSWKEREKQLKNNFYHLFEELSSEHINIISSEAFQNCDPDLVRLIFSDYDVEVICYIRNELDYIASSYSQKIHASDYCEDIDTYADKFQLDYATFLDSWDKAFAGNLSVRSFEKKNLEGGNVVIDFVKNVLKIESDISDKIPLDANPSLGERLLTFKKRINQEGKYIQNKALYKSFSELSTEIEDFKFKLPIAIYQKQKAIYEKNQRKWSKRFLSVDEVFEYGNDKFSLGEIILSDDDYKYLSVILDQKLANISKSNNQKLSFTK